MSALLLILRIIGILLLAVLGLILCLILSVLLVPVRYRIRGFSEPEIAIGASFFWMFPLVRFFVGYEKKTLTKKLWILGIPVSLDRKGKKNARPKKRPGRKPERAEEAQEAARPPGAENASQEAAKAPGAEEGPQENPMAEEKPPSPENASGIRKVMAKIRELFRKVSALPRMIKEKVAKLKEMALRIWQEIRDETNRRVLKLVLREGKVLLGHYLPRKIRADVRFAMADPALTGQLLGAMSLFPILLRPQVVIRPDFMAEKMYFTGSFEMKGRVRTVHVIVSAVRLWRDQDVKKLIQRVRNRR